MKTGSDLNPAVEAIEISLRQTAARHVEIKAEIIAQMERASELEKLMVGYRRAITILNDISNKE